MADSSSSTFSTMADDCNFETTLVPYPDPRLSELSETGNKLNHTPEQPRNSSFFDLKTDVFREVSHIKSDSFVNNCSDVASQKADYRNFVIQQELEGEEKVEVAGDAAVSLDDSVLEKKEEQDSNEEEKVEMAGDAATGLNDIIPEKQEKQGFEEEEEVEKACPATTCSNANVLKKQESASTGAADGLNDTDLRKQEPKPEITGDLNGIVLEKREKGFSGVKERLEFEKNGIFLEQREKSLCGEKETLELDGKFS